MIAFLTRRPTRRVWAAAALLAASVLATPLAPAPTPRSAPAAPTPSWYSLTAWCWI